jgi:hypothetical protein
LKTILKTLVRHWLSLLFSFLLISNRGLAQPYSLDLLDFNAGLSTTDNINIGVRYHFNQNNIGVNVGTVLPEKGFGLVAVSATYYRHLFGHSMYTHQRPWYVKSGVHYVYSYSQLTPDKISDTREVATRLHLGRDFNFSRQLGLTFSLGPMLIIFSEFYDGTRSRPYINGGFDILLFYRLACR